MKQCSHNDWTFNGQDCLALMKQQWLFTVVGTGRNNIDRTSTFITSKRCNSIDGWTMLQQRYGSTTQPCTQAFLREEPRFEVWTTLFTMPTPVEQLEHVVGFFVHEDYGISQSTNLNAVSWSGTIDIVWLRVLDTYLWDFDPAYSSKPSARK